MFIQWGCIVTHTPHYHNDSLKFLYKPLLQMITNKKTLYVLKIAKSIHLTALKPKKIRCWDYVKLIHDSNKFFQIINKY